MRNKVAAGLQAASCVCSGVGRAGQLLLQLGVCVCGGARWSRAVGKHGGPQHVRRAGGQFPGAVRPVATRAAGMWAACHRFGMRHTAGCSDCRTEPAMRGCGDCCSCCCVSCGAGVRASHGLAQTSASLRGVPAVCSLPVQLGVIMDTCCLCRAMMGPGSVQLGSCGMDTLLAGRDGRIGWHQELGFALLGEAGLSRSSTARCFGVLQVAGDWCIFLAVHCLCWQAYG